MSQFSKPKFAPNGAKTIPLPMDGAQNQLGMAIQLGDGGSGGPSKLGSLVRGQMPPRQQPRLPSPQGPAREAPPPPPQAQPQLGAQSQAVVVEVVGVTPEGEELVDQVELTFPPGTTVQSCRQIGR